MCVCVLLYNVKYSVMRTTTVAGRDEYLSEPKGAAKV